MKSRKRKLQVSEESGHAGDSLSFAFKGVNMSKKPKNRNANKVKGSYTGKYLAQLLKSSK
jgi:hypothetical protein